LKIFYCFSSRKRALEISTAMSLFAPLALQENQGKAFLSGVEVWGGIKKPQAEPLEIRKG
jgi:hypothetical protein